MKPIVFTRVLYLPQRGVDRAAQVVAALREHDAQLFIRELRADRRQRREADCRHVTQHGRVADNRVDAAVLQIEQREIDRVVLGDVDAASFFHLELRGRVDLHPHAPAFEVVGRGKVAGAFSDGDQLARIDVGVGEQQRRPAFGRDRHRRDDEIERAVLQRGKDAVEAGVDEHRLDAQLARNAPAQVDVEPAELAPFDRSERRVRGIHPDPQLAGTAHAIQGRLRVHGRTACAVDTAANASVRDRTKEHSRERDMVVMW